MSDQENNSKPYDPFEAFRGIRDAYLDSMSRSMVDAVNTEAYAQATGAILEGCLSASAPFREVLEKSMVQTLQQLSLPSRQEVAALAERFTNVEMRLDDMDAKLDRIERLLLKQEQDKPSPAPPPSRTGPQEAAGRPGDGHLTRNAGSAAGASAAAAAHTAGKPDVRRSARPLQR